MTTIENALDYEISASYWWLSWVSAEWAQDMIAAYFAWKVNRKWRRYRTRVFARNKIVDNALSKIR